MMTIGSEPGLTSKIGSAGVMVALVLLFVALSQPAWRGEAMAAEFKSDCAKQRGVLLEHKGTFGTTYKCAPRLDRVEAKL